MGIIAACRLMQVCMRVCVCRYVIVGGLLVEQLARSMYISWMSTCVMEAGPDRPCKTVDNVQEVGRYSR